MTVKIGCQAVAFGPKKLQESPVEALNTIAAVGFPGVEIGARFLDLDNPEANRELFAARGLKVAGLHHGGKLFDASARSSLVQQFERVARCAQALECPNVIVSGGGKEEFSAEDIKEQAETLQRIGEACSKYGCKALYHNHAWEFDNQAAVIHELMQQTEPESVGLATDLGWGRMAGMAPVETIKTFFDRLGHLHVRDYVGDKFVELGLGAEDNVSVIKLLHLLGYEGWVVVEMELHSPRYGGRLQPPESIAVGYGYLNGVVKAVQ